MPTCSNYFNFEDVFPRRMGSTRIVLETVGLLMTEQTDIVSVKKSAEKSSRNFEPGGHSL